MSTATETKSSSAPTVIVVAGASRGIGLEYVVQLLKRKDVVLFATARTPSTAKDLIALKAKHSSNLHILALTVDDEKSIALFAAELGKHTKYVDLLINNAGVLPKPDSPKDTSFQILASTLATNTVQFALLSINRVVTC
jgi:NAD(P)-dependent dehydrogenase (short-subunit alcohol dehydrogenase family)